MSEPPAQRAVSSPGSDRSAGWRSELAGGWPVAAVFALSGIGVGLLWVALAPEVPLEVRDDGIYLASPQPWEPFATQAVFGLLGLVAGLVAGVWAWLRGRRTPFGTLAGLLVGGAGCALLAWQLGAWLGPPPLAEVVDSVQPGDVVYAPLGIDAWAVLLAPAVGAVLAYLVLDLLLEERPASSPAPTPAPEGGPAVTSAPPGPSSPPSS
jgi:hypothetical protein